MKIHLRLIEKEQSQKTKDGAEVLDKNNIYNKQTSVDSLKTNDIYGVAGDDNIFNDTPNLLNGVTETATNNNIENTSFLSPRKKKAKAVTKPKRTKTQEIMPGNLSTGMLPSTSTSLPDDINNVLTKQEKVDGISLSVSDEQYQIYLIET